MMKSAVFCIVALALLSNIAMAASSAPEVVAIRPLLTQVADARNSTEAIVLEAHRLLTGKKLDSTRIGYELVQARFKTVQQQSVEVLDGSRYITPDMVRSTYTGAKSALSSWQQTTLGTLGFPTNQIPTMLSMNRAWLNKVHTPQDELIAMVDTTCPRDLEIRGLCHRILSDIPPTNGTSQRTLADWNWVGHLFDPTAWKPSCLVTVLFKTRDELKSEAQAQRDNSSSIAAV